MKNFLIVLLMILIVGGTGYAIYYQVDKFNKESNVTNESKKEEVKEENKEELSSSEFKILKEHIQDYNTYFFQNYPLSSLDSITNQKLLEFAYVKLSNGNSSFSSSEIDNVIYNYFGDNKKVVHEDLICLVDNKPLLAYDADKKTYNFNMDEHRHGGSIGSVENKVYYMDKVLENNKLTIKAKVLYSNYYVDIGGPNNAYYTNYNDSKNHTNAILGDPNKEEEYVITDSDYEKVKDKIPVTIYEFTKDKKGNYGLKSVKIEG